VNGRDDPAGYAEGVTKTSPRPRHQGDPFPVVAEARCTRGRDRTTACARARRRATLRLCSVT